MSQKAFTFCSNCKGFALVRISHLYNFPSFLSNLSFLIYSDPYSKQEWSNVLYSALMSCCAAFFRLVITVSIAVSIVSFNLPLIEHSGTILWHSGDNKQTKHRYASLICFHYLDYCKWPSAQKKWFMIYLSLWWLRHYGVLTSVCGNKVTKLMISEKTWNHSQIYQQLLPQEAKYVR